MLVDWHNASMPWKLFEFLLEGMLRGSQRLQLLSCTASGHLVQLPAASRTLG